jgi:hypothetical protein
MASGMACRRRSPPGAGRWWRCRIIAAAWHPGRSGA